MKTLVGLAVSAAILALLYIRIDVAAIADAARGADPTWLAAGLLAVVPLTLLTAWRLTFLTGGRHQLGFGEANRLILASGTLNLFLPSKLGDLAKGHVLARRHGMKPSLAYSVVVLEKSLDMMSLLVWGAFALTVVGIGRPLLLLFLPVVAGTCLLIALLVSPLPIMPDLLARLARLAPGKVARMIGSFGAGWQETTNWFWRDRSRALGVVLLSIVIWGAHLCQFWLFANALGSDVPLIANAAFATLSILVGLLPFTFAGVGTRDAAIVFFYAPFLSPAQAALLGMLATLRYVLPAVAGAPFVADFTGMTGPRAKAEDGKP